MDLEAGLVERLERLCQFALSDVRPRAHDFQWCAGLVVDGFERVLEPAEMTVTMTEAVFQVPTTLRDQTEKLRHDAPRILRMDVRGPEIRIVTHLPLRVAEDLLDVLADERAGIISEAWVV